MNEVVFNGRYEVASDPGDPHAPAQTTVLNHISEVAFIDVLKDAGVKTPAEIDKLWEEQKMGECKCEGCRNLRERDKQAARAYVSYPPPQRLQFTPEPEEDAGDVYVRPGFQSVPGYEAMRKMKCYIIAALWYHHAEQVAPDKNGVLRTVALHFTNEGDLLSCLDAALAELVRERLVAVKEHGSLWITPSSFDRPMIERAPDSDKFTVTLEPQ